VLHRFKISTLERGFLFKGRDYVRYLAPGTHWVWGFGYTAKVVPVTTLWFRADDLVLLVEDPAVRKDLAVVELKDHERALVWVDGWLWGVLQHPGRYAFWTVAHDVAIERLDARSIRFDHEALATVLVHETGRAALDECIVAPGSVGLFLVDEKVREVLGPGRYALWKKAARARVQTLELREQVLELQGQELLTKDKVTVRLNVALSWKIEDPRRFVEAAQDSLGALYREAQLAVRSAVAGRTLDELLVAKEAIALEVQPLVARRAAALGATVASVGLKDVILPGEVRSLLHQVVEAEKKAQANLITRREETAATRALLNTAKLYAEHPALLRLKELETAEKIAEHVTELRVSGLDEVLARLAPSRPQ
jgi:regulator of protease activity HflC (stomatin/prohibitin superfamily)